MNNLSVFFKLAFAFLLACVISLTGIVDGAMATGQFSQTCEDIGLGQSLSTRAYLLNAQCEKIDGSFQATSIDLDESIGNLNGTLSWGDANFSKTCKDIGLGQDFLTREYTLNAQCEKVDGITYEQTDINLDEHIANIDGVLEYE